MGLRAKLLVTLLGLLLLSVGVLGAAAYWLFEGKLRGEALSYQRNIASQLIIGARAEGRRITAALKQLSENTALISEVERGVGTSGSASLQTMQESFDNFQRLNSGIAQVILFDQQSNYILHSPSYTAVTTTSLNLDAIAGASEMTRRFMEDASGDHWVISVAPVHSRDVSGDVLGYIATVSGLDSFKRMVEESDSSITRLFFSDNSGHFLVKSPEIPFNGLPEDLAKAFNLADARDVSASGVSLSVSGIMEMEADDEVEEVSGFSSPYVMDMTKDDIPYQLSMQRVGPNLWLGSLIDQRAIANNSLALLAVLLPAAALVIALSGLIFYLRVFGMILKPVEVLIQATRKISAGEFQPDIEIAGEDELGELADAFRVMGRQLEDSGRQIAHLAYFDPLTELPNRTTLRATLSSMIEEVSRNGKQLAVLFIDLDDFKKVNDRLGHAAGDELLVQVGKRLQRRLRSSDVLADGSQESGPEQVISRRGGDEFNAILNNVHDAREAALVAERLIVDINEPLMIDGSVVTVGASVGVALFPGDGEDADTLLRHADMAMYEAKGLGKNKYYLFTESINAQVHERLEMEQSIAGGLQRNEFEVHYQPKVDLKTLQITGFEALIRWHSPTKGLISPADFIPLAEESQLIHDIGHWMMAETLHQIHEWRTDLPDGIRIAINISARQMAQENFAEHLISLAEQFDVPLTRLEVELTETSILIDEVLVRQHLYALRTAGVKVSLDDFGTGYSSLTFLRSLPIDTVKIDRSFVQRLQDHEESRAIVLSVLELCQKLSLQTVAEGIEKQEQFEILLQHGCDEGQGYLLARPIPADNVLHFLAMPGFDVSPSG